LTELTETIEPLTASTAATTFYSARWFPKEQVLDIQRQYGATWTHHLDDQVRKCESVGDSYGQALQKAIQLATEYDTLVALWAEISTGSRTYTQFFRYCEPGKRGC
jgi:hypothetical protein